MNSFNTISVDYLRPSRTIETVLVSNSDKEKLFFVYNYDGNSFRVFLSMSSIISFFAESSESDLHFESELTLDNYFENFQI